jgi:hypothetical protein
MGSGSRRLQREWRRVGLLPSRSRSFACLAEELAKGMGSIFLRDKSGNRAVFGSNAMFNTDPYWRDLIPCHEYFDGDTGRDCGASHQTGWTGLIAQILVDSGENNNQDKD